VRIRAHFHEEAGIEYDAAFDWYLARSPDAARKFDAEVERAITQIVEASEVFTESRMKSSAKRKRPRSIKNVAFIYAGNDLLSHTLSRAVQSARRGLTSVFGMGTGGPPRYDHRRLERLATSFSL
jgi:plasmid stabilization system protein ParE